MASSRRRRNHRTDTNPAAVFRRYLATAATLLRVCSPALISTPCGDTFQVGEVPQHVPLFARALLGRLDLDDRVPHRALNRLLPPPSSLLPPPSSLLTPAFLLSYAQRQLQAGGRWHGRGRGDHNRRSVGVGSRPPHRRSDQPPLRRHRRPGTSLLPTSTLTLCSSLLCPFSDSRPHILILFFAPLIVQGAMKKVGTTISEA
jgi:hypothetical protein